ncbi:hypothetical protein RUND412_009660 [Rhizina undulata]
MTTLEVRPPYTPEELKKLYPKELQLHFVQVIFRHGERTPINPRFQNAGLPAFWPYCNVATRLVAAVMEHEGEWSDLKFRRRLETFGKGGSAVDAEAPFGDTNAICLLGELTDKGRETTLALGKRLRKLYINQLGFLPHNMGPLESHYLRATPIVRALESLQEVFTGLYPPSARPNPSIHPPIRTRFIPEENLYPNEAQCRRFLQLARAFSDLAVKKWNDSPEMAYLQSRIGKWVPDDKIAVDGHPRLSGILDTVNSTLAHGEETRLPKEFYDPEVRRILNLINVDEWFRGYDESKEYRSLGVGSLLGDVKNRIVQSSKQNADDEQRLKIALYGCHDTTIAGLLASLGSFDKQWPPFTANIAFETFRRKEKAKNAGVWDKLFGRKEKEEEGWYVRVKYNDHPVVVKGCRKPGNHLEGDETFCTMTAFREIVAKIAPKDWRKACLSNIDKPPVPEVIEEVE